MDEFDFNAPIITTVIYDDTDDEEEPPLSTNDLRINKGAEENAKIFESRKSNPYEPESNRYEDINRIAANSKIKNHSLSHNERQLDNKDKERNSSDPRAFIVTSNNQNSDVLETANKNQMIKISKMHREVFDKTQVKEKQQKDFFKEKILNNICSKTDYTQPNQNVFDVFEHKTKTNQSIKNNDALPATKERYKEKGLDMPTLELGDTITQELNNVASVNIHVNNRESNTKGEKECERSKKTINISTSENKSPEKRLIKEINNDINTNEEIHRDKLKNVHINQNELQNCNKITNTNIALAPAEDFQNAIRKCLQNLLSTVSENMICIMNAYHTFLQIYKRAVDRTLVEKARNNFLLTKNHFFDLSYSSVINIIVQKENDSEFLKSFVEDTVKLAHSKSFNYSYENMRSLFIEMIDWVKRRKKYIQNTITHKTSNPLLSQMLNKPSTSLQQRKPPTANNNQNKHRKATAKTNRNYSINPFEPTKRISNNMEQSYSNNQHDRRMPSSSNVVTPIQCTRQCYVNQTYNMQNHQDVYSRLNNKIQSMENKMSNYQTQMSFNNVENVAPPYQTQVAQSWQNEPVSAPRYYTHQQSDIPVNNQYGLPENLVPVELQRSSISRDSGVISPLNFNNNSDQLRNYQEEQCTQAQPFITHVTSLNPTVAYITEGSCRVCGRCTKTKCLGCYKLYYCSTDCQYRDWKTHMLECKTLSASKSSAALLC